MKVLEWGTMGFMKFSPKVVSVGNLRVVLVKDDRQSVTVRALIGTGSREETDKEAGSAHFLEHFVFKGTKEFPGMFDINDAVEKVGGAFNAFTGQAEMGFWVKMDKSHLKLATKIIGQLLTEPILPKDHFDKERGTILEELNMYEDRPNSKAAEVCESLLYGKTNIGRPIIGTVKSLKAMTVEDLRAYFDKWFVASNIIVGVVGDYGSEEEVLEIIRKEFSPLINDKRETPNKDFFEWSEQAEPRSQLVSRKVEQAAVVMAFKGLPIGHKLRYAMELANIILGDGWISRLLREVRENRGWAYAIGSGIDNYIDAGDVMIGAGLPKSKLNEAVELIVEISLGIGTEGKWGITKEELKVAKDCFRGRLSLSFDKPEEVLGNALDDLMFENKIYTPEMIIEETEKVTMAQVREVCKLIFRRENLSVGVVGNYKKLDFKI